MKIVVAPDKFKGSLTSFEVCDAISTGIRQAMHRAKTFLFPMADGGDGFARVMKHYQKTQTVYCTATDPVGRDIEVAYEWNAQTRTAIVEMAAASGLELLSQAERNPLKTSTYGTGLLIRDAIYRGAEEIILGLGGSATNDAGMGVLKALGFQFLNEGDNPLYGCGGNLQAIRKVIPPLPPVNVKFTIACDVQNVLYGPQGAAYIYAPQKGADSSMVKFLDEGLKHFAFVLEDYTGKKISDIAGTGAAGGIAAGLMSFFNVEMKKGVDLIVNASGIKSKIDGADLLITGEGKIDYQTLEGKVVNELSSLGYRHKVPVGAFCGALEADESLVRELHLDFVCSLTRASVPKEETMANARIILINEARRFFKHRFTEK